MSSKIKGILACIAATVLSFYAWGVLSQGSVDPTPALMTGGIAGILCGAAIAFIAQGTKPLAVGVGSMLFLYGVVSAILIQAFGTGGLDVGKLLLSAIIIAGIGAIGGTSYKFAAKPEATKFIGD